MFLVVFRFVFGAVNLTFSGHFIAFQIFVVGGDLVDQGAVWQNLHDPVGSGLNDLMVAGSKQQNTWEFDHAVV